MPLVIDRMPLEIDIDLVVRQARGRAHGATTTRTLEASRP